MAENLKTKIVKQIKILLNVPILDPIERRRSWLLNILLLGILLLLVAGLVLMPILILVDYDRELFKLYPVFITAIVALGILYGLNRRVSGKLARGLFLLFMLIVSLFVDYSQEVVNGRSLITFVLPIMMASVLFPPYASFIVAGLAGLEVVILSLMINLPPDPFNVLTLLTAALIAWLLGYTMERAIRDYQQLNQELDQRVKDRTQELATALEREHVLVERERTLAMRNETILNSIADGVLVFNANQKIVIANPAANHFSGRNLLTLTLPEFLDTIDESERNIVAKLVADEKPADLSRAKFTWQGRTISANIAPVVLPDIHQQQVSIGNVMVLRDFTKEAELERAKDAFVGMVSHELRTPLTTIQGFSEILLETSKELLPETDYEYLQIIYDSTRQMRILAEELIDLSRIETGELELYLQWVDLTSIVEHAAQMVEQQFANRGLNLNVNIQTELSDMYLDQNRITQILLNLLSNAYKYTSEGGATVKVSETDGCVTIQVSDTGVGIKPSDQKKLFERFFRADDQFVQKAGGTGLGLNITKGLVELHGGTLSFESEYGEGTTFVVALPKVDNQD